MTGWSQATCRVHSGNGCPWGAGRADQMTGFTSANPTSKPTTQRKFCAETGPSPRGKYAQRADRTTGFPRANPTSELTTQRKFRAETGSGVHSRYHRWDW